MPGALDGKVIVVIGGTTGIGFAAAKSFLAEGARLVVAGRDEESASVAETAFGSAAIVMRGDATDPKLSMAAINVAAGNFKRFDGLYHVAGGSGRRQGDGPLHELSDAGWDHTLNLNLTSVFYSNRAAVQQFLRQQTGGSILNVGSVLAEAPSPYYFATHGYTAAKAGIIGFTRAAASYYAASNIRFNVLAPGAVATPMSERAQGNAEIMQFLSTKQPLDGGRMGRPTDLDAAAVFFLSDASRFVTGQVLAIDGGWSISDGQIPAQRPAASQTGNKTLIQTLAGIWNRLRS